MELILRIDGKGGVLIPASIRKSLGFKRAVKARVKGGRLILEPLEDPLEELTSTVIEGSRDVEREIARLRKVAEEEALESTRALVVVEH